MFTQYLRAQVWCPFGALTSWREGFARKGRIIALFVSYLRDSPEIATQNERLQVRFGTITGGSPSIWVDATNLRTPGKSSVLHPAPLVVVHLMQLTPTRECLHKRRIWG